MAHNDPDKGTLLVKHHLSFEKLISFSFVIQKNHPMKAFYNRGWQWLSNMEKIMPIAGVTGAHSYAPTEANPSLPNDQDEDAASQAPTNKDMDINIVSQPSTAISASTIISTATSAVASASTTAIFSPDISLPHPAAK